uniref:FACT complex subunit n=1 Tax=Arundo donax TaxID=35708 RepID=A0A0A9HPL8_ARUDO
MAILEALDQTLAPVSGSASVSPEIFIRCLKKFYSHWNTSDLWGSSSAIAVATPPPSENIRYQKSLALSTWFFGREFADTIMVFLSRQIHFLSRQEGSKLLEPLRMPVSKALGLDIVLHNLEGDNGSALMDKILHTIFANSGSNSLIIGHIAREKPEGKILEEWSQKLHGSRLKLYDVSAGLSELAVKDVRDYVCEKGCIFNCISHEEVCSSKPGEDYSA